MVDFDQEQDIGQEEAPEEKYVNLSEEDVENAYEIFDHFDSVKDQTIEMEKLGPFLRWMNFNPTKKDLKEYADEFDPTHRGIMTRNSCLKIVDRL